MHMHMQHAPVHVPSHPCSPGVGVVHLNHGRLRHRGSCDLPALLAWKTARRGDRGDCVLRGDFGAGLN